MKTSFISFLIVIGLGCGFECLSQERESNILVKLKDTTALRSIRLIDSALVVERIFPYSPKLEGRHQEAGLHLWYSVKGCDRARAESLITVYKDLPGVEKVELDRKMNPMDESEVIPVPDTELRTSKDFPVNDPLYDKQWDLQNHLYPRAVDVSVEKAWQLETGSSDVIVAVMDGAFDVDHEDLKENVWVNECELNGKKGVDDDGNGYIDDIYGYSEVGSSNLKPVDHATHVAGTIAAVNNNGIGVCGIAGGNGKKSGVKIMRCRVIPSTSVEAEAQAYVYAADNGAVISQNSWLDKEGEYGSLLLDGIKYFMEKAGRTENAPMKGGLVVWGAGNDNRVRRAAPDISPILNRDNLITVASVGPDGDKASYSNYGDYIDVAAPGGELGKGGVLSTIVGNRYGYMQGTSMACPHVSGIAALVVSKFKGKNLTPKEVKRRILSSSKDLNRYMEGRVGYGLMGTGVADAWRSLLDNQQKSLKGISDLWISKDAVRMIELSWIMPDEMEGCAADSCVVYYGTSPIGEVDASSSRVSLFTAGTLAGDTMSYRLISPEVGSTCYFRIQCKDKWGNCSALSKEVSIKPTRDIPVIASDYSFNQFYVDQHRVSYMEQQDSLLLNYRILFPSTMQLKYKIEDPGKAISVTSFQNGQLGLLLAPIKQDPKEYVAQIIVCDKKDDRLADTLALSYFVRPSIVFPTPSPVLKPGKSLNFSVDKMTGHLELNLPDYIEDPLGLGLYWDYSESQNREKESMYCHGLHAVLDGNILKVDYDFDEKYMMIAEKTDLRFGFRALSYSCISVDFPVQINYTPPVANENAEVEIFTVNVFPNPVENVLQVHSVETIKEICIYSLEGNMVLGIKMPENQIDLSQLSSGIYLIRLTSSKGDIVKKIIKK